MAKIDRAAQKWKRKAEAAASIWEKEVKNPETFNRYVSGLADFLGISESTVAGSEAAQEYRNAMSQVTAEDFRKGIARASPEKWKRKMIEAFSH